MALSSLDQGYHLPEQPSHSILARSILQVWSIVLSAPEAKPFSKILGQALELYIQFIDI